MSELVVDASRRRTQERKIYIFEVILVTIFTNSSSLPMIENLGQKTENFGNEKA